MKAFNEGFPGVRRHGPLQSLRSQLALGLFFALIIPWLISHVVNRTNVLSGSHANSVLGAFVAIVLGTYLFRRFDIFPGVQRFAYVLPSFLTSYGIVLSVFFFLRLDYGRVLFGLSFAAAIAVFFMICRYSRRPAMQRFYVVPFGNIEWLRDMPQLHTTFLTAPSFPDDPNGILVADLRAEIDDPWERMIAETAISGRPVYHTKQLRESVTGCVQIEHLSENSFGSLLPNLNYRNVKRAIDIFSAIVLIPVLAPLMLLIATLIKIDSKGPAFFVQQRMGYRSEPFPMLKFRTMRERKIGQTIEELRLDAVTQAADDRVTRVGRFLRRTRLDELPQVINILRGEMSWIGPRPEAIALAEWYESEIPFYAYRHIVRPGITGWAQVNQGHVAGIDDVHLKLHYDFYYIKNFSAWLDLIVVLRTSIIIITGFGSK